MNGRADRFDRLYTGNPDPWSFRISDYERTKYDATIDALPAARYRRAIEAGCSIGELTKRLGARADAVIGLDVSEVALAEARRSCAGAPHIGFRRGELPDDWPAEPADLIVLSEILYFLRPGEIRDLAGKIAGNWLPGGDCVLVNYLGPTDEALQGPEAARLMVDALRETMPGLDVGTVIANSDDKPDYQIQVLRNPPGAGIRA